MELWLVSIPIEGHPLPKEEAEYIKCGEVIFHQYNDPYPEYGKRFVASTIVEGNTYTVVSKAKETIEDAITKLTLTSGLALKLDDSYCYLTPKKESGISGIPSIGGEGFRRRVTSSLTLWYGIGEDDTNALLSKMDTIKAEKKELFNRALKHYRIAVSSPNPFQEIVSYFSAVSIITSATQNKEKPDKSDLREALKCVAELTSKESKKAFNKAVDKYYEIDRTVAAHGTLDIDVLDAAKIKETNIDAKNLKLWVRKLLIRYLNDNQIYNKP
jgi:hypothetical protein